MGHPHRFMPSSPSPMELHAAILIAESFLEGEPSCLILGDNLFYRAAD